MLLAAAVLVGVVAGSLREPAGVHVRRPRLGRLDALVAGAIGQGLVWVLPDGPAAVVLAASLALLLVVAVANRAVTGIAVIAVGLAVNLTSVAVNGGMPVRAEALVRAGIAEPGEIGALDVDGGRHLERPSDRAPVLGDALPVPGVRQVVSFGDLIVLLGALDATFELARRRRRPWDAARRDAYAAAWLAQRDGAAPAPHELDVSERTADHTASRHLVGSVRP